MRSYIMKLFQEHKDLKYRKDNNMTEQEKSLLLKDLCARLPYGVKFHYTKHPQSNIDRDCDETAIGYYCNLIVSANYKDFCVDRCKLYLRPMSSMTDTEAEEFTYLWNRQDEFSTDLDIQFKVDLFDWLNAHYFDYRGLIEKGLALEAPEGMYK